MRGSRNKDIEFFLTGEVPIVYYPRRNPAALFRQYRNLGRGRARNFLKHRRNAKPRHLVLAVVAPAIVLLGFCSFRIGLRRSSPGLERSVYRLRLGPRSAPTRPLRGRIRHRRHGDPSRLVVRILGRGHGEAGAARKTRHPARDQAPCLLARPSSTLAMTSALTSPVRPPVVSVIMANHNRAAYLADAIASVRQQSMVELELIVSDDASTDDSARIVEEAIAADQRIRLVRSAQNSGPAAARNKALAVARGDWIAVMDSDDLMHSDRLRRLVAAAQREGADIVADDLVEFDSTHSSARLLTGNWAREPFWVDIRDYLRLNMFYGSGPALGYLKPLFRRSACFDPPVRYDETLRIGEDFDLVLRLLHAGKKFRVYPSALYFYRKHAASTSHRLNEPVLIALKAANLRFLEQVRLENSSLVPVVELRDRSIETALAYERLLRALKDRDWRKALGIALKKPSAAALLRLPIGVRLSRLLGLAGRTCAGAVVPIKLSTRKLRDADNEARMTQ